MANSMPHNIDAEKAIIAAILTRPDYVAEVAVDLGADDFYNTNYGTIWHTFNVLYSKEGITSPDVVTLCERSGNILSPNQLIEIQIESPTVNRQLIETVLRHSASREMIRMANTTTQDLLEGADPYERALEIEKFVTRLGAGSTVLDQEALTIEELADQAEDIAPVIIPGLCNRDFRTIVVAEEGAGKSLLLRTIAQTTAQGIHPFNHRAIEPKRTLVVDLENPAQAIIDTSYSLELMLQDKAKNLYDAERFRIWRRPGGINIRRLADRAALQREIAFHQPELVTIGPIYKMYQRKGGESYEDSADEAMHVLDDLRTKYNFALYMEHHAAKGKQGEGRDLSPMGSQRWMAWPEIGISLYRDKQNPTEFIVKRFRGDRLSGVNWPTKITRNPQWLVDGVWDQNGGAYG